MIKNNHHASEFLKNDLDLYDGPDYLMSPHQYYCGDIREVIEFLEDNLIDRIYIAQYRDLRNGTIMDLVKWICDNPQKAPKEVFIHFVSGLEEAKIKVLLAEFYDFSKDSRMGVK